MSEQVHCATAHSRVQAGFTMIEMVVTLLILGLLAGFAVARFNATEVNYHAEVQALQATLRFAQILSMGDDEIWNVDINGDVYELQRNCTAQANDARLVRIPGQESTTYGVPHGVSLFGTQNIAFNNRGQPCDCQGQALNGDTTVVVQASALPSGSSVGSFVLTQNTGFIQ